jgi:hypothetical protein
MRGMWASRVYAVVAELYFVLQLILRDRLSDKFHLHIRCLAAWEFERTQAGPIANPFPPS